MMFIQYIFYLLVAGFMLYTLLLVYFSYGWFSLAPYRRDNRLPSTRVTIIVPACNEQDVIKQCLTDLLQQDYPKELYEIFVAENGSEDHTAQIVKDIISVYPEINLRCLSIDSSNTSSPKKKAITESVQQASGSLIVTTDADCRIGERWLSTLVNYYETYKVSLIAGPVAIEENSSVFSRMQSLEFMTLIASAAGAITLNRPVMCNGANMAYEKKAFEEVGGYSADSRYASGDDIFLLHAFRKKLKKRIGFIRHRDAVVYTRPAVTVRQFWHQRMRWISKSKGYRDIFTVLTALVVFVFNLALFACFMLSIFYPVLLHPAISVFIMKVIIDLPLIAGFSFFVGRSHLLVYLLPVEFLNMLYTSVAGLSGHFVSYAWKNRKYRQ